MKSVTSNCINVYNGATDFKDCGLIKNGNSKYLENETLYFFK